MKHQKYRHVTSHNSRWVFQLSVLGHPVRTNQHYDTAEDAAVACDLVKHYLRSEFKLDLPASLDGEQFSCLAYSRRNVDLSSGISVFASLPPDVKGFLLTHQTSLEAHKSAAPPETTASKFRRSDMIKLPAVREWVERLEAAESDAIAFSALNSEYFFRLLDALPYRLDDFMKPLRLAHKMHVDATNPRLADRAHKLDVLSNYVKELSQYVVDLTADLRAEQASVESAVSTLEANRPNLS